jgi:aspartyl protease family protein
MSDNNPWTRPDHPPPRRNRAFIIAGILIAVTVGLWLLSRAFPERTLSGMDEARMLQLILIITVAGSGILMSRQFTLKESARNIAIWIAIAAVLVVGYLYRDLFSDFGTRFTSALMPGEPVATGGHTVVLSESDGGSYFATGEVDGQRVRFQVDTGATDIVLSPEDARRVGIDIEALRYDSETSTANGIGHGASYTVNQLSIGPIHFSDVPVSINQAPMGTSLLGMAFLRRLKSFEFKSGKLLLHW